MTDAGVVGLSHFVGGSFGDDLSGPHQVDAVGDGKGFGDIVGDHDGAGFHRLGDLADEFGDDGEGDGVQSGEGLVVQDEVGVQGDGAREGDAPCHSAGEFGGMQQGGAAQPDGLEFEQGEVADGGEGQAGVLAHGEGDIVQGGEVGEQAVELEHHSDFAAEAVEFQAGHVGEVVSEDADFVGFGGEELPADVAQEGGFSAAAAAHDGDDFAVSGAKGHIPQDGTDAVREGKVFDFNGMGGHDCGDSIRNGRGLGNFGKKIGGVGGRIFEKFC